MSRPYYVVMLRVPGTTGSKGKRMRQHPIGITDHQTASITVDELRTQGQRAWAQEVEVVQRERRPVIFRFPNYLRMS